MFMNGVDRMDQRRATLATQRKEQRIQMTLFTFILDLAVTQGFAIYQKLVMGRAEKKLTFFNFKRNLCDSLIMPLRSSRPVGRPRKRSKPNSPREGTTERTTIEEAVGTIDNTHMLVENLGRKNVSKKPINEKPQDIDCYLCRKMGLELKTIYSCIKCRKGFHVNCFTAFHFRGALSTCHKALLEVVLQADDHPTVGLPSKYAPTSIEQLKLPTEKSPRKHLAKIRTKANRKSN